MLAHPLRLRLLSLLTGTARSASEAARELGDSQANISYHLRRLEAAGLVVVAEEVMIRGGRSKRYRHEPTSREGRSARDPEAYPTLMTAIAGELQRRAAHRRSGTADAFTDAELWIDPAVWRRCLEQVRQVGIELHQAARPPDAAGAVLVSATIALFELMPAPSPTPALRIPPPDATP